jgi:heat shock protein HslJ
MSKICLILVVLVLIPNVVSGCTNKAISLGQEFTLKVGETAELKDEDFSIKFIEVTQDSRCATGATCVWAGEVEIVVEITDETSTEKVNLVQPGLTDWPSQYIHKQDLAITYNVKPYPELDKEVSLDEYTLEITIDLNFPNLSIEDTKWFLRSYGELNNPKAVIEGTSITATFDRSDGQVTGSSGCNTFFGRYQISGSGLRIIDLAHTEMACLSPSGIMEQEQEFLSLLASTQSFTVDATTLTIICDSGLQLYFTTATR